MAQEKPPAQFFKERQFLHYIRLCEHNQGKGCRPLNNLFPCNFAHWLKDLHVPEECLGQWSKVWQQGNVDMCFWPNYTPNQESLKRFTRQFLWEQSVHPHGIPNWAWGHAVQIGLITEAKVPLTSRRTTTGLNCKPLVRRQESWQHKCKTGWCIPGSIFK